jgi:SAM-dependent methyltransferase
MWQKLLREAQVWRFEDLVVLTDPRGSERRDAVFPLCRENMTFVNRLRLRRDATVLDLCTGSGILALAAARAGSKVLAMDVSERAVLFARANVALNGMEAQVEVQRRDLFDSLGGRRFDCILANPPFEPLDAETVGQLHSDGGPSGVGVTRSILRSAVEFLTPGGCLQISSYLPGDYEDWEELKLYRPKSVEPLGTVPPRADAGFGQDRQTLPVYLLSLQVSSKVGAHD